MMELTVTAAVKVPDVPDYFTDAAGTQRFPLTAFTEEGLRKLGNAWIEALVDRARELKSLDWQYGGR